MEAAEHPAWLNLWDPGERALLPSCLSSLKGTHNPAKLWIQLFAIFGMFCKAMQPLVPSLNVLRPAQLGISRAGAAVGLCHPSPGPSYFWVALRQPITAGGHWAGQKGPLGWLLFYCYGALGSLGTPTPLLHPLRSCYENAGKPKAHFPFS